MVKKDAKAEKEKSEQEAESKDSTIPDADGVSASDVAAANEKTNKSSASPKNKSPSSPKKKSSSKNPLQPSKLPGDQAKYNYIAIGFLLLVTGSSIIAALMAV